MSWGDVKDIKFQNEIFTDPLCLRWDIEGTKKKEQKSAGTSAKEIRNILIYGRNGSGKTSISRAIAHMGMMDGTSVCRLYGGSGEQIPLNDALKENVFVFNEDYIDKNIRIEGEGLHSIVIFGEQVELDNQIQELERQVAEEQNKEREINANKAELEKSYNQSIEKIFQRLKQDGGWAARASDIKGNKINERVSEKTIKVIMSCRNTLCVEDVKVSYERGIRQLNGAKDGVEIPENPIDIESAPQFDEERIIRLISRNVKRPVLEEREKHIIGLLQSTESQKLRIIKDAFQNKNTEYCPFCFRPISNAEKRELVEKIEKLLSNELEQYVRELENIRLNEVDLDASRYSTVDKELVAKIQNKILRINQKIRNYKQLLEEKKKDIFQNVDCSNIGLNSDCSELVQMLNQLNEECAAYQKEIRDIKKLKDNLLELNNRMGKEEIKDLYYAYKEAEENYKKEKENLISSTGKISKIKEEIAKLEAKKINIAVAVNEINDKLYRVFLSRSRLQVEVRGGKTIIY